jgi:hypothetical protein
VHSHKLRTVNILEFYLAHFDYLLMLCGINLQIPVSLISKSCEN